MSLCDLDSPSHLLCDALAHQYVPGAESQVSSRPITWTAKRHKTQGTAPPMAYVRTGHTQVGMLYCFSLGLVGQRSASVCSQIIVQSL